MQENWIRKEHFNFFNQFDEPFFGITANIECSFAYRICKQNGFSFFLYYLHQALYAVNQIDELKTRFENPNVVQYQTIHASPTISRADNTFGFSFILYKESFTDFIITAKQEIENIRNSNGLGLTESTMRNDVIHFSALPWISFTSVTHARHFQFRDSIPKITFGKYFWQNDKLFMPVSINAHHGLADGFHAATFLQLFESQINNNLLE